MAETFTRFDVADFLHDEADIAHYLEAASEQNNPGVMVMALGDVARARNTSQLARDAGITRIGLTRALSAGGNPSFATVVKVANALGVDVLFRPRPSQRGQNS